MLHQALFEIDGPVAVRYPRGGEGVFNADTSTQAVVRLKDGCQAVLITYGTLVEQALSAAEELERSGISTRVVKLNRIAPLDTAAILRETEGAETVLILEDCFENGSVGQQLARHGRGRAELFSHDLAKSEGSLCPGGHGGSTAASVRP